MENLIPNPSPPSRIPLLGDARSEPQETNPRFPPLFRIPSYSGNGNWVVGFGDELNPGGMSCSKILKPLATNTHNKSSEAIPAECFTAKGMKYPSKFPWENPKSQTPHLGSGTTQPRSANNFISSFFFILGTDLAKFLLLCLEIFNGFQFFFIAPGHRGVSGFPGFKGTSSLDKP